MLHVEVVTRGFSKRRHGETLSGRPQSRTLLVGPCSGNLKWGWCKWGCRETQNATDMVDSGAPPTNHENLLALLQLLRTLPLWFAFVLLCFARLVLHCEPSFWFPFWCPFRSTFGPKFRLLRIAPTSHPNLVFGFGIESGFRISLHIESGFRILLRKSGFRILLRHRIRFSHFASTPNPVFAFCG